MGIRLAGAAGLSHAARAD